eukprot:FR739619.1.p1 GENE.FR739619.1~~FR739619.1.p1  ORF type:complete len:191 (+),score=12.62 FR739619.1:165-737(+)
MMRACLVLLSLAALSNGAPSQRSDKAGYARYLVTETDWAILSTISTMEATPGAPFGNPQSHADINGTLYFYVSDMDQSMIDIAANPSVSYALSAAEKLTSPACGTLPKAGDPESPLCTRLTINGQFVNISGTDEAVPAQAALFAKHPAMATWPADHSWFIAKIEIQQLWEINMFGGASVIEPEEYYNVEV